MDFKLEYSKRALKQIFKLDKAVVRGILQKLDEIMTLEDPMKKAKRLKVKREDIFRFRVGDYRVVFRKDNKSGTLVILVVLRIQHRKDVYEHK